jgi:hypothetical protein
VQTPNSAFFTSLPNLRLPPVTHHAVMGSLVESPVCTSLRIAAASLTTRLSTMPHEEYEDEPTLTERPCRFQDYLLPRRAIIPDLDISSDQHEDPVCVSIGISADNLEHVHIDVHWFVCVIDTKLRCFTSNPGLNRKLYANYLHVSTATRT